MSNKRIMYLEYLRVFSMFSVILIHSCITAITDFNQYSFGTFGGVVFFAVRNICHFAVPIFFMITGALFLNPNKVITIEKLGKKYIAKYIFLIFFFGWGFAFAEEIFLTHKVSLSSIGRSFINMIEGNSWNHMWYLYELVGILLVLPIFKAAICKLSNKEYTYLFWVIFGFTSVIPMITNILGIESGIKFPFKSVYILYLFLGYWLSQGIYKLKNKISIIIVILSVVACIVDAYLYIMKNINLGLASYSSPIIVFMASAIFIMARNTIKENESFFQIKAIPFLSNLSLGVYIIHMLWINLIYKAFKINPFEKPIIMLFGVWIIVSVLSIISAWIMKKIPLLNKFV